MKLCAAARLFFLGMVVFSSQLIQAQNKSACELISKADMEAVVGVSLQPPVSDAPFRSLLDPDFTDGKPGQVCNFTNYSSRQAAAKEPRPAHVVTVALEVRYSAAPDAGAVDWERKQIGQRTYDVVTDVPDLGDAAIAYGGPGGINGGTHSIPILIVFRGGTMRLMIESSEGLTQEKQIAAKILGPTATTGFAYGSGLAPKKPAMTTAAGSSDPLEKLKNDLKPKAESGDAQAQLALAGLFKSGKLGPDGNIAGDNASAAYWYKRAADRGNAQAAYELAGLYQGVPGVAADPQQRFQLLQKAAEGGYVPAMSPLSAVYAAQRTPTSRTRATYWAQMAAQAGDPYGWLTVGVEYSVGLLGGEPSYWYSSALEAFRKSAALGNCEAMLEIADAYTKGRGVAADKNQAQNWTDQATNCERGDLEKLRQQAVQFRTRAANARDGNFVLPPVPSAVPPLPAKGGRYAVSPKFIQGMSVIAALVIALSALNPSGGGAQDDGVTASSLGQKALQQNLDRQSCVASGANPLACPF